MGTRKAAIGAIALAIFMLSAVGCTEGLSPGGGWAAPVLSGEDVTVADKNGDILRLRPGAGIGFTPLEIIFPGDNLKIGKIYGTPLLDGNALYLTAYDCNGTDCEANVTAIDVASRTALWDPVKQYTPPGQDASERNTTFQGFNAVTEIVGQAALDGDTLVVGTSHIGDDESPGGFLVALDAAGSATNFVSRVKWTFPVDDFVWSTPVVSDGVAYFTSLDKHVYAVDLSDDIVNAADRLIWSFEAEGALTAKPLIVNGMLYVGDLRGNFYALDLQARARTSAARALDPATEWRAETNAWVWAPAIEEGGVIYVSTLAGTVHAFDALSGTVRWAEPAKIDGQIVAAPLLIDGPTRPSGRARDRLLAVPSGSDDVWVLDALTGQDLGKFATEGGVKASPAATGNTLYVHTLKRQLQWFSLQDRALLGCVKLNNGEDCR